MEMGGGEWGSGRRVKGMVGCMAAQCRVRWEEAKMACEITSDAILPI